MLDFKHQKNKKLFNLSFVLQKDGDPNATMATACRYWFFK